MNDPQNAPSKTPSSDERACPSCGRAVSPAAVRCPSCGRSLGPVARTGTRRSSNRGIWLLLGAGCALAILVFGGVAAAVFLPDFLDALQKTKQKRTMADLRIWGVRLESYRVDHGEVPEAASVEELARLVEWDPADDLPTSDAWGTPFRYACWSERLEIEGCDTYRLVSAGRDGTFQHEDPISYEPGSFDHLDYGADLVLGDGYFYRYPAPGR